MKWRGGRIKTLKHFWKPSLSYFVMQEFSLSECLHFKSFHHKDAPSFWRKIFRQLLFLRLLSFHPGGSSWCGNDDSQNGKQNLNWSNSSRKAFPFGVWHTYICVCVYTHTHVKAWPEIWQWWSLKWELSSRDEAAEAGKGQVGFPGDRAVMVCFLSFYHTPEFGEELPQPELHEPECLWMQYHANRLETGVPTA